MHNCTICDIPYGIMPSKLNNGNYVCGNCSDGNCSDCRTDYRVCVSCKPNYGLNDSLNNNVTNPAECKNCDGNCTKMFGHQLYTLHRM